MKLFIKFQSISRGLKFYHLWLLFSSFCELVGKIVRIVISVKRGFRQSWEINCGYHEPIFAVLFHKLVKSMKAKFLRFTFFYVSLKKKLIFLNKLK